MFRWFKSKKKAKLQEEKTIFIMLAAKQIL